jgi:hypothetical protein
VSRSLVATVRVCVTALVAATVCAGVASAASAPPTAFCSVGGAAAQPCQSAAWYTAPVTLTWSPNGSNLTGDCENYTYNQDTNEVAQLTSPWNECQYSYLTGSGTVSGTVTASIDVEISSPAASATPSRPPDTDGWYSHPVSVSFGGSSFSGITSCSPPQTYAGPDTAATTLTGSCVDNAGKIVAASYSLQYDATPPTIDLQADPGDQGVGIDWRVSSGPAPLQSVQLTRTPGMGSSDATVVYSGGADSYRDARVKTGTHYRYTLTATDAAGNVATRTLSVTPSAHLLSPLAGAAVSAPVMLTWTSVPKASYYNVQLYRRGKILSTWPQRTGLKLAARWTYRGHRHRLSPGRYRWYVWPGFGPRFRARYGAEIGSGTFVVR